MEIILVNKTSWREIIWEINKNLVKPSNRLQLLFFVLIPSDERIDDVTRNDLEKDNVFCRINSCKPFVSHYIELIRIPDKIYINYHFLEQIFVK